MHVQFYLTLLDTYVPDRGAARAFAAVENIPSIKAKADFCFQWIDSASRPGPARDPADRRAFLLNLICFAACIEGLFFYGAFAYVYFLGPAACSTASPRAPTGSSATSPCTWRSRSAWSTPCAPRSPTCSTTRCGGGPARWSGGGRRRAAVCGRTCRRRVAGLSTGECAATSSTSPTGGSSGSGSRRVGLGEPVGVHGAAGRAGAVELLRAAGLGLPGRRGRPVALRRRVLTPGRCGRVGRSRGSLPP